MNKKTITEIKYIVVDFSKYFTQIGPNSEKDIGTLTKNFKEYNNKQNFPVRESNIGE